LAWTLTSITKKKKKKKKISVECKRITSRAEGRKKSQEDKERSLIPQETLENQERIH
jgi:hypothetical protein